MHLLPPFHLKWLRHGSPGDFFFFFLRLFFSHGNDRYHLFMCQRMTHCFINAFINLSSSCKPHLQLSGMNIYIQVISGHLDVQRYERKFVLHHKALVGILNCFCNNVVFYVSAIDIVVFKGTVSTGNFRFSRISLHLHKVVLIGNFHQRFRDISAVNIINDILHTVISGSVKLHLFILNILKRDFRMGKGKLLHHSTDIVCLCHIRLQKLASCRGIVKKISHQKGGSLRCSHFLYFLLYAALDDITDSAYGIRRLCDQLHL